MSLSKDVKERISLEVINILVTRFETFPEDASNNRNAPFHEAFLKAFRLKLEDKVNDIPFFISLSSWLQGLNTTLGQVFFENVAHHLSHGEKREFTSKKLGNLKIYKEQKDIINNIITDLSTSSKTPNMTEENKSLFIKGKDSLVDAIDFSVDVFIEDDNNITAIELKSVKPNSGEMRGEKQKILEGKAALYKKYSNKNIQFYIGFPFDPTSDQKTTHDKTRFLDSIINMTKYFDPEETLIASELWDLLSGTKITMEEILEVINTISTVEFIDNYKYLNDNSNNKEIKYSSILNKWNLFSELKLVKNIEIIKKRVGKDKTLIRTLNQKAFNSDGVYNVGRYNKLINLLDK